MLITSSLEKIKCNTGTAIHVLKGAAFELHKWNSNVPELEADKIARHMPRISWG